MTLLRFEYYATARDGASRNGIMEAQSWAEAYKRLLASGLTPVRLTVQSAALRRLANRGGRITVRELSQFTHQFSVLTEARIPLEEGLRSIAAEEPNPRLKSMIEAIAAAIGSGSTITESMQPFALTFGNVYLEAIRAAEKTGRLTSTLSHLSEMLEQDLERRATLRAALLYPVCVVASLALACVFLLVVVVPRVATVFASRGALLPLPTRMLIGASEFLQSSWWLLLPFLLVCVLVLRRAMRTAGGARLADAVIHRIPIVGHMRRLAALARFAHTLGLALSSGLGLIESISLAGRAAGHRSMEMDAQLLANSVAGGGTLSEAMNRCEFLTGFVRRLLSAGEQSAEMSKMCAVIARNYDREVSHTAKNMATLIEPLLIAALAGVVLFLALAIFLPMWDMMSLTG